MARLFVGNFSFEYLQDRTDQLPARLLRLEAEMSGVWQAVADPGDFILCSAIWPDEYLAEMQALGVPKVVPVHPDQIYGLPIDEVICWGWTQPLREWCDRLRFCYSAPPQEIIWLVNSREFSCQLEAELGCGLPGTLTLKREGHLFELFRLFRQKYPFTINEYLFKPNLSQSGRGQFRSETQTSDIFQTLLTRINNGETIIAEPFVEKAREVGCQWEISVAGECQLLGIVELFSNERGAYQGSRTGIQPTSMTGLNEILRTQQKAVEQIAGMGYFGPVGIDAMLYHDASGQMRVRPLQDINARWTMGRIALGWDRVFSGPGQWLMGATPPAPHAIRTSPQTLDQAPMRQQTWWTPDGH